MAPASDDPHPTVAAAATPPVAIPHDVVGTPGAPRLVLLHGFTQNRRCWGPLPRLLAGVRPDAHVDTHAGPGDRPGAATREVVVADAPGHGDAATLHLSLADAAGPYADALAGDGPASWLGYSMGGRLALHVALAQPHAVGSLVLVGASPGIADAAERARRRAADDALAERVERLGTAAFVDEWLDLPLFDGLTADTDQRQARYRNDAAGLASSLRLAGTGAQASLWTSLGHVVAPVLLVVGERDHKFRGIAELMASSLGGPSDVVVLTGTGHSCHLEAPQRFSEVVDDWLVGVGRVDDPTPHDGEAQAGTP